MQLLQGAALTALLAASTLLSGCSPISNMAIDGFVAIKPHNFVGQMLEEYCGPDGWGQKTLDMSNITGNIWWPGCNMINDMSEFAFIDEGGKCPRDGCIRKETMDKMDQFNKANGGVRVLYPSRPGKDNNGKDIENINLVGWWLPAPMANASTPRIVLQHGFSSNSNKFRTQFLAYQLRSMGFSVLVNNFRDHCYSANSTTHIIEWGGAYPLDLLGAWDYAKNIAGGAGPIAASKVGILGISMGGFITANVIGLEPQVPAAWIDSAPFTPRDGFEIGFKKGVSNAGIGFMAGMLTDSAWKAIVKYASARGVDLHANLPEHRLPQGPDTQRPIFVTSNVQDDTVPFASTNRLVDLIKALPTKYTLSEFWVNDGSCAGKTHAADMMMHSAAYAAKMCKFWSGVFAMDSSTTCGQFPLDRLYEQEEYKTYSPTETAPANFFNVLGAACVVAVVTGLAASACRRQSRRTQQQVSYDVEEDAGVE